MNKLYKKQNNNTKETCYSIFDSIPFFKKKYKRIVLVSHQRHLDKIEEVNEDTLVVSYDWLLYQKCLNQKIHCIYFEVGLLDWSNGDEFYISTDDLYIRTNDWLFLEGKDLTRFKGVSLGAQFARNISSFIVSYNKLMRSLNVVIEKYKAEELLLYDCRTELGLIDPETIQRMVSSIAEKKKIKFINNYDPLSIDDPDLPLIPLYGYQFKKNSIKVNIMKRIIYHFLSILSQIRILFSKRQKIFFYMSQHLSIPLIRNFSSKKIFPIFEVERFPFKKDFFQMLFAKGVLVFYPTESRLSSNEKKFIDIIINQYIKYWSAHKNRIDDEVRNYIEKNIFNNGHIYLMAKAVKRAIKIFKKMKPDRIIVDGVFNPPGRIYIELATQNGIATDYIWHGIFPHNNKLEALGCDNRYKPLVTRFLSWGKQSEDWLKAIGAKTKSIIVGNPSNDEYVKLKKVTQSKKGNILLLQYTPINSDMLGLNDNQYTNFVNVVKILQNMGHTKIKMKLHPGIVRREYFERISEFFDLNCPVYYDEPFKDLVDWADFVIGPASSGAFVEVMAAGKNYYAFIIPPHSINLDFYHNTQILESVDDLQAALKNNKIQNQSAILEYFCSINEIPNSSKKFWEILENDIS